MVMGHNTGDARYILTGNSIEDLEKGLAEMKRQIAAGISFSVCYGGDKSELEKEYDSEYECEDNDDWDICYEEEEEEEEVDKNEVATAIAKGIVAAIKDFLGM